MWTCPWSLEPGLSAPPSPSWCRSESSGQPSSSSGPIRPTVPTTIYRLLARPGELTFSQGDGAECRAHGDDRRGGALDRARPTRRAWQLLMLEIDSVSVVVDGQTDPRPGRSRRRGRRDGGGARPERRREEHLAQGRGRAAGTRPGTHPMGRIRPRQRSRPTARKFGLMFQDYALFPHLDVAGNVGFGSSDGRRIGGVTRPAV